jgi:hypothetical protein
MPTAYGRTTPHDADSQQHPVGHAAGSVDTSPAGKPVADRTYGARPPDALIVTIVATPTVACRVPANPVKVRANLAALALATAG